MKNIIIIPLFAALLTFGCTAHKPDIQQGNVVTQEKLDALKLGMDRKQVRFIMGTPLLEDPFHAERWDYFYSMQIAGKEVERYGATLYFDGDRLARIEKNGEIPANEKAAVMGILKRDK